MQRILILGATGRTGKHAVAYALSKELETVALVRSPHELRSQPGLRIVQGTPEKLEDVERAMDGCDAVVSVLNDDHSAGLLGPRQLGPSTFLPTAMAHTVAVMKRRSVRRIVVLSAAGAGDSFGFVPRPVQWLIQNSRLKHLYAAHTAQEQVLQRSELDWTLVRAVALFGRKVRRTRISYDGEPRPGLTISRKQVAMFLIDCLLHPEFYGRAPIASAL